MSEPSPVSAGKLRGLIRLAGADGRFRMVAVDPRPPLFAALARARGVQEEDLSDAEIAEAKAMLVRVLGPHASALLLDPVWAHPAALLHHPSAAGLLSTLESHDPEMVNGERRSRVIDGWSVAKARRCGADAVKLLVWHRPDLSDATRRHQDAFVREAGAACRAHDLPFVLEILTYPRPGEDPRDPAQARHKPERVLSSLAHFAAPEFGVDLFKLQMPVDLQHVTPYAAGALDGVQGEPLWELGEVRAWLRRMDEASPVPWVLLSAGVGPRAFETGLGLALEAGASGFLAGRAVWLDALAGWPDRAAVDAALRGPSTAFLRAIGIRSEGGMPWFEHRRFRGTPRLDGAAPGWARAYPEAPA